MKGYYVGAGYMGLINGNYMLFATESEYVETWREVMNKKLNVDTCDNLR